MSGIEQIAEYVFRAESDSSTRKYIVTLEPGKDPHCECMAFAMNRNKGKGYWCKHTNRASEMLGQTQWAEQQKAEEENKAAEAEFEAIKAIESLRQTMRELQS